MISLLLTFTAAAFAATPETSERQGRDAAYDRYLHDLAQTLSTSNQPRDWYVAARLLQATDGFVGQVSSAGQPSIQPSRKSAAQRDGLILRAQQRGHDDPVLLWSLALSDCPASPLACNRPRAIARLRELVPDNAAVWLLLDASATHVTRDFGVAALDEDVDLRLERVVNASGYDSYYGARLRMYLEAFEALPVHVELLQPIPEVMAEPTPEAVRAVGLFGLSMAATTPISHLLREACRPLETTKLAPERHALCLQAARIAFGHADTALNLLGATRCLLGLLPDGDERRMIEQAMRALEWQQTAMAEAMIEQGDDAHAAAMLAARWREPGATELSVMRALLREHQIPLDPPPGWRSWRETEAVDSVAQPAR